MELVLTAITGKVSILFKAYLMIIGTDRVV